MWSLRDHLSCIHTFIYLRFRDGRLTVVGVATLLRASRIESEQQQKSCALSINQFSFQFLPSDNSLNTAELRTNCKKATLLLTLCLFPLILIECK